MRAAMNHDPRPVVTKADAATRSPGAQYAGLLRDYWRRGGEEPLIQAADLGKKLVHDGLPPEDIGEFQQQALIALGREIPTTTLDRVAERLTPPLIELLMAYGLTFREQLKQRYEFLFLLEKRLGQTNRKKPWERYPPE
jgi:hypothetical protein